MYCLLERFSDPDPNFYFPGVTIFSGTGAMQALDNVSGGVMATPVDWPALYKHPIPAHLVEVATRLLGMPLTGERRVLISGGFRSFNRIEFQGETISKTRPTTRFESVIQCFTLYGAQNRSEIYLAYVDVGFTAEECALFGQLIRAYVDGGGIVVAIPATQAFGDVLRACPGANEYQIDREVHGDFQQTFKVTEKTQSWTYHHLSPGDCVVLEYVTWDAQKGRTVVVDQYTRGHVTRVGEADLSISVSYQLDAVKEFSRTSGVQLDGSNDSKHIRISRAHAQSQGVPQKPYKPPSDLPSLSALNKFSVYPTQPLVSAAMIIACYPSPEAATVPRCGTRTWEHHSWYAAEGDARISGAGGQASKAIDALLKYRQHGSIDMVISDLHNAWRRTISDSNYPEAFIPGQEKANELEPVLRKVLVQWL